VEGRGVDMAGTLQPLCRDSHQLDRHAAAPVSLQPVSGLVRLSRPFLADGMSVGGDARDTPDPFLAYDLL
jgi:hypothetical protein